MLPKAIAQIIVSGTQVVGRAFARALKQEFKHAGQAASNQKGSDKQQTRRATASNLTHGLSLQEAHQILNTKPEANPHEIMDRYNKLFSINEKAKGGSFYIQSKVYRARERIAAELESQGVKLEDPPKESPKNETPSQSQDPLSPPNK